MAHLDCWGDEILTLNRDSSSCSAAGGDSIGGSSSATQSIPAPTSPSRSVSGSSRRSSAPGSAGRDRRLSCRRSGAGDGMLPLPSPRASAAHPNSVRRSSVSTAAGGGTLRQDGSFIVADSRGGGGSPGGTLVDALGAADSLSPRGGSLPSGTGAAARVAIAAALKRSGSENDTAPVTPTGINSISGKLRWLEEPVGYGCYGGADDDDDDVAATPGMSPPPPPLPMSPLMPGTPLMRSVPKSMAG
ncbi:unnamed protein product [Phaeothamnion confervicola]